MCATVECNSLCTYVYICKLYTGIFMCATVECNSLCTYVCIYIYIYVNCILGYSCVLMSSVIVYVHMYIYICKLYTGIFMCATVECNSLCTYVYIYIYLYM